ncbi:hypothetical protein ACYVVD_12605, partial [Arenicellales bacterium IMCC58067]
YKVGMPWPLERRSMIDFTRSLKKLIVVEEKRPLIEDQVRQFLCSLRLHADSTPYLVAFR